MNDKNIKIYDVDEGDSGVLYLTDQYGNTERYQPDCDLDKTQELLYGFYRLKTNKGGVVKDSFVIDGHDWFPNTVSTLYWQYFFQVVKYRTIVDKYIKGEIVFSSISTGRFLKLISLIDGCGDNILKRYAKNIYNKIDEKSNECLPGVTESYEISDSPELLLNTADHSIEDSGNILLQNVLKIIFEIDVDITALHN